MGDLTGKRVDITYEGLIKTNDEQAIEVAEKRLQDGIGNNLPVSVGLNGMTYYGDQDFTNATVTGISGVGGTSGTSGTSGVDGTFFGSSGTSGTSGTSGAAGATGAAGTSGTSGTSGINGATGATGTSGTSGTSGVNGVFVILQKSGTVLDFATHGVFNTQAAPGTGSISADLTGAQNGFSAVMFHNSATVPSFGIGFQQLISSYPYQVNNLNIIYFQYFNGSIYYNIQQV